MKHIAVIGSGSWGVALSMHLAKLGNKIKLWSHNEEECNNINNNKKCKFLPNIVIDKNIECYTNYKDVIEGAEYILHVTPSKFVRDCVQEYKKFVDVKNQPIIICSKGFESHTKKTLDEVILEEIPNAKIGALSGPSHAEEVSGFVPTVLVIASKDPKILQVIQDTFSSGTMRIYTSTDLRGVELGGALKNIIAFCSGAAVGLKLGDNASAALITRGLGEMARLGVKLGGKHDTFYGLSGLGDLIVTCLSEHSRNRKAGKLIGEGKNLEEVKKIVGMTIESIDNIDVAYSLAKNYKVEVPILECVHKVLYENLSPKAALEKLMLRDNKPENNFYV